LRRASHKPVIEQFIAGGFRKPRDDPPNGLVAGAARSLTFATLPAFEPSNLPGFVLAVISFELEQTEKGKCLSTETRV